MPGDARRRFRARIVSVLCAATMAASLAWAPAASATSSSEERLASYHNRARVAHDRDRLALRQWLSDLARAHSRTMADAGRIFHSTNLAYKLRSHSWDIAGENVGMGPSMYSLHKAFMNSPGHRANILNRRFKRFGVGVVWRSGVAFVTVIFMDY